LGRSDRELLKTEKKRLKKQKPKRTSAGPFTIWARILLIVTPLTLGSLVAASFLTPLFAIERISVSGNERIETAQVTKALSELEGRPLTTVSAAELATLLGDISLIETFTFTAEPPNTLRVKIRERQPLLVLFREGQNWLYDAAGVKIEPTEVLGEHPFLVFQGDPAEDSRYKYAVELLLSLPLETYRDVFSVEVSEQLTSKLTLKERDITVIWGANDEALLKAEVLDALIANGVEDQVTIDVSSPNSPVVRYSDY
jgi:cell division protein FtsQ